MLIEYILFYNEYNIESSIYTRIRYRFGGNHQLAISMVPIQFYFLQEKEITELIT